MYVFLFVIKKKEIKKPWRLLLDLLDTHTHTHTRVNLCMFMYTHTHAHTQTHIIT